MTGSVRACLWKIQNGGKPNSPPLLFFECKWSLRGWNMCRKIIKASNCSLDTFLKDFLRMKGGGGSGYFCYYYGVMLRISIDLHISLDITSSITFKFKFAFWVIEPWKSPAFDIKYSSSASSEPKKSWNAKERKWMNHFITLRERLFYFQFQFLKKCRGRWRTISIAEERIGAWRHWA